jgi:hypothetical protein
MLQLLRVRRARKAAVAAIHPHVERSRAQLHGISEGAWRDPYVIGFLAMLITLVAQRSERRLGEQALGLVQLDAWEEITGTKTSNIGEDICLLSATGDTAFRAGCDNALLVFEAIEAEGLGRDSLRHPDVGQGPDAPASPSTTLWSRYFDERLGGTPPWSADPA